MKLKKIASLMLAGIMAVSMLAACKDGSTNNGNAGSSSSTPTVSGMAGAVEAAVKKANPSISFTVKSNSLMDAALKDTFEKTNAANIDYTVVMNALNAKDPFGMKSDSDVLNTDRKFNAGSELINYDWDNINDLTTSDAAAGKCRYAAAVIMHDSKLTANFTDYASELIGIAMREAASNISNANNVVTLDIDYTLYVSEGTAKDSNDNDVPGVVVVLKAEYSQHM